MKIKRMRLRAVLISIAVFFIAELFGFSEMIIRNNSVERLSVEKSNDWNIVVAEAAERGLHDTYKSAAQPAFVLSPYGYSFIDTSYTQGEIVSKFEGGYSPTYLSIYQNIQEEVDILEIKGAISSFSMNDDVSEENDDTYDTQDKSEEIFTSELFVEEVVEESSIDLLVEIAGNVIFSTETCAEYGKEIRRDHYQAINSNDNGALSIGRLQWHAGRAKKLLQRIQERDPELFDEILIRNEAESLKEDVLDDSSWSRYRLRHKGYYYNAIKELLGTDVGIQVQDDMALADVKEYIDIGIRDYGIKRPQSLIYFADLANQYGVYDDVVKKVVRRAKDQGGTTLDNLYEATLWATSKYKDRRKSVYTTVNGIIDELPSITDYVDSLNNE